MEDDALRDSGNGLIEAEEMNIGQRRLLAFRALNDFETMRDIEVAVLKGLEGREGSFRGKRQRR